MLPDFTKTSDESFEPVCFDDCDCCGGLNQVNEFSLCITCDADANTFNKAAGKAKSEGNDPWEAGIPVMDELRLRIEYNNYLASDPKEILDFDAWKANNYQPD